MSTPSCRHPEILFVDPEPLPQGLMLGQTPPLRVMHNEDEALAYLRNPGHDLAVIAADHRLLRRMASTLSHNDQMCRGHLVRLLITDGRHPQADFAAINEAPVFRILEKPFDPFAISQHLHEAMGLCARQRLASSPCEGGGAALRDALAFLAHEINTPLSLIQGYAHALTHRQGIFSTVPAPTGAVKQALEVTERSAGHCLSLMTWVAETAQNACPRREMRLSTASAEMRALLQSYPFAGEESDWVSIAVEHDFPLPSKAGLLHLVLFTLMRTALDALQRTAQPRLRITLGVHEGASCIRFSHNGKRPPAQALDALTASRSWSLESPGRGLVFCQRVMRGLQGDFRMVLAPNEETVTFLRFGPTTEVMTDSVDPRKKDLALRLSP